MSAHLSQTTTIHALNRETRTTHKDGKTAWHAKQQVNMNSAGRTVTDGGKSEGLVIAVLVSAVRMNDMPRSIQELPFSHFPSLNKGWRTV